jgi:hypothetical protein
MLTAYVRVGWRLFGIASVVWPVVRDVNRARHEPVRTAPADTLDSLRFWVARRQNLPFYRLAARREADKMIRLWQARAVRDLPASSLATLADGGLVTLSGRLVRYHTTRWLFRKAQIVAVWTLVISLLIYAAVIR